MPDISTRVYGDRARIGLVVPSTNTVAETEFWRLAPKGVSVHTSRMPFFPDVNDEPFAVMEEAVPRVLEEAVSADPSVIAYGCTASSAVGNALDKQQKLQEMTNRETVTAAGALLAALRHLNVTRVVLVTPYPQYINDKERVFFAANGIEVIADESVIVSPAQQELKEMYKVPTDELQARAIALGQREDAEAVVLSCCDMPTLDAIDNIETALGKPVISSVSALFWQALEAARLDTRPGEGGRLLREG
ncbi:MAG: aspartate/glutamate racemase family protein [Pseudomonadota bacterium]